VPRGIARELLDRESGRFPEWAAHSSTDSNLDSFLEREQREWKLADLVICGSDFVRESVQRAGGPPAKCRVVPYGGDFSDCRQRIVRRKGPLRVLTVGAIGLRKGSPYVFRAAEELEGRAHFRMVGRENLSPRIRSEAPANLELVGAVARDQVEAYYRSSDVFLLPSICEGSAMATYEGLAHGLPVICTPNAGSVVRDGVEGFIVPIRDVSAIVEALERLVDDRDLLQAMSDAAIQRSREYSLERYGERLLRALATLDRHPPGCQWLSPA
jgi:glycosyltransferase involved in cell wall biosynthesis